MRITESQLRRIIRQEVQALREARRPTPAQIRNMSAREYQKYRAEEDKRLLAIQRKAAGGTAAELSKRARAAAAAEPARAPRSGTAPTVTGGRPKVRAAAQEALEMYYADYEPEQIIETMVEMTAKYEPGYRPSGELGDFNDRMKIIGDQASEAVALIARVDPEAAEVLEAALGEFDGF